MPTVMVYKVKCFDVVRGEERILRSMATRSGARLLGYGFEIVEGSGLEVDPSQLEYGELWTHAGVSKAPGSPQEVGSASIR